MDSLIRWEPIERLMSPRSMMERFFDEDLWRPFWMEWFDRDMALDIFEKDGDVVVKVSLPGVKPEDVHVDVVGNELTIQAEIKTEEKVEERDYMRHERRHGMFSRCVTLPDYVKTDEAKAEFEHGVLTLTIPKTEEVKSKQIEVKVK